MARQTAFPDRDVFSEFSTIVEAVPWASVVFCTGVKRARRAVHNPPVPRGPVDSKSLIA